MAEEATLFGTPLLSAEDEQFLALPPSPTPSVSKARSSSSISWAPRPTSRGVQDTKRPLGSGMGEGIRRRENAGVNNSKRPDAPAAEEPCATAAPRQLQQRLGRPLQHPRRYDEGYDRSEPGEVVCEVTDLYYCIELPPLVAVPASAAGQRSAPAGPAKGNWQGRSGYGPAWLSNVFRKGSRRGVADSPGAISLLEKRKRVLVNGVNCRFCAGEMVAVIVSLFEFFATYCLSNGCFFWSCLEAFSFSLRFQFLILVARAVACSSNPWMSSASSRVYSFLAASTPAPGLLRDRCLQQRLVRRGNHKVIHRNATGVKTCFAVYVASTSVDCFCVKRSSSCTLVYFANSLSSPPQLSSRRRGRVSIACALIRRDPAFSDRDPPGPPSLSCTYFLSPAFNPLAEIATVYNLRLGFVSSSFVCRSLSPSRSHTNSLCDPPRVSV